MSDLFNEEQKPTTQEAPVTTQASSADIFATQLMNIRNERGEPKYDSIEKALDALKHSQEYIPQLKTDADRWKAEAERLQAELAQRASIEDTLSRFTNQRTPEAPSTTTEAPKALDETAVEAMLQRALTAREQQQLSAQNISAVTNTLTQKFGEKAKEVLSAKAQELGMSLESVKQLAASSPTAVLAWFNSSSPSPSGAPVRSTVSLPDTPRDTELKSPSKSLLRGATSKDQIEFLKKIREEVYRKHGIDS
jgi:hypothetical protein